MKHLFMKGTDFSTVLVLLHGTGGDETSLLPVGRDINPKASLLSIKGSHLESGMPRYFRRLETGLYDEHDLDIKAKELHSFILSCLSTYDIQESEIVLVGYSNGANIGLKLLLSQPDVYQKAILFHPMYPVATIEESNLKDLHAFITFGKQDPIVPVTESLFVEELLVKRGATVSTFWTQGHQLTLKEVESSKQWLSNFAKKI